MQLARLTRQPPKQFRSRFDQAFFRSTWRTDLSVYEDRLRAIGFVGHRQVLDAGCGFGAWSCALARLNDQVTAIDVDPKRVRFVSQLARQVPFPNLRSTRSSIERTGLPARSFDAVFCYSALYFTDFRKTLREFRRVLKPGGTLYLCSNGLGWYLHNLLRTDVNPRVFDVRAMAAETLAASLEYYSSGIKRPGTQIVTPRSLVKESLRDLGFSRIAAGDEGTLQRGRTRPTPFFRGEYCEQDGVFEILAIR